MSFASFLFSSISCLLCRYTCSHTKSNRMLCIWFFHLHYWLCFIPFFSSRCAEFLMNSAFFILIHTQLAWLSNERNKNDYFSLIWMYSGISHELEWFTWNIVVDREHCSETCQRQVLSCVKLHLNPKVKLSTQEVTKITKDYNSREVLHSISFRARSIAIVSYSFAILNYYPKTNENRMNGKINSSRVPFEHVPINQWTARHGESVP